MRKRYLRLVLLSLTCVGMQPALAENPLPVETFAELPPFADISLSADGSKAVALRAIGDTYQVVLFDFDAGKSSILMASDPENFLFNWCRFANATRVVCSIRSYIVMRAGDIGLGNRWYRDGRTVATRLVAVDIDGTNQLQLVPQPKSRLGGNLEWNSPNQATVLSWMYRDKNHILMSLAREDQSHPSVYKLNINNNRMKKVQKFSESIYRWYADSASNLRFAVGGNRLDRNQAFAIKKGKRTQVDLDYLAGLEGPSLANVGPDGKSAWVYANKGANTRGIHRINIETGELMETLFQHPEFDVDGMRVHPRTHQPIYVRYADEYERLHWFDKALETQLQAVRKAMGSPSVFRIVSTIYGLERMVLFAEGPNLPPSHFFYTTADKSLAQLGAVAHGKPVDFKAVSFKARDGLTIPGYLALPGPAEEGPYPTVIRPHGGPWAQANSNQYFITQFLVNRGYAVLRPNFRGSTGYGDKFVSAGFDQWGLKMQDDLVDGIDWMVEQGYADPERICMAGGSYGGYASLVAAYKSTDKIQCAVSFAGVSDLNDLKDRWYLYDFGRFASARVQSGVSVRENSPLHNVDQIKVPLLLVHGDVDVVVGIEQTRKLVDALEKAGKPYTYIEQTNGDHHYSLKNHRLEYLTALEVFLQEHIGAAGE